LAPAGNEIYYVLAPVPHLRSDHLDARAWRERGLGERYADVLVSTLEARGYVGLGDGVEVRRMVTPAGWAAAGRAAGTPLSAAHTCARTGPSRAANSRPVLSSVVFVGAGTQPGVGVPMVVVSGKLAAARVTGS